MLRCIDIMRKNHFDSYSEFYLICAIARDCLRRGEQLDVSGMSIEKDSVPSRMIDYFKALVSDGAIVGIATDELPNKESLDLSLYMDTSCFSELEDKLFKEEVDHRVWSYEVAFENYRGYEYTLLKPIDMGNILIHIVAYHIVSVLLGQTTKNLLKVVIDNEQKVKSTYIYINLLSCSNTLSIFDELVQLAINFSDFNIDLEYSIFCNNGIVAGRNKLWTINEKKEIMEKEGIVKGGIYVLWERKGMNESNPIGRIDNCVLVRLDDIDSDHLYFTCLPLVKTKEEITDDYYSIPETERHKFTDLLDFTVNQYSRTMSMYSIGIRNYLSMEEDTFVDLLDKNGKTNKKVTIDGNTDIVEMSEIDAIYWLLCQFNVEFDKELYKNMYSPNENLLWDMFGEYV